MNFDNYREEFNKMVASYGQFCQEKQNELLIIEQKIKQAEEELATKQAAAAIASPEVPRDIRTEIFSHLQIRQPEETKLHIYAGRNDKDEFVLMLYCSGLSTFWLPLLHNPSKDEFQQRIRNQIIKLSYYLFRSQLFEASITMHRQSIIEMNTTSGFDITINVDKSINDFRDCLTKIIENIDHATDAKATHTKQINKDSITEYPLFSTNTNYKKYTAQMYVFPLRVEV